MNNHWFVSKFVISRVWVKRGNRRTHTDAPTHALNVWGWVVVVGGGAVSRVWIRGEGRGGEGGGEEGVEETIKLIAYGLHPSRLENIQGVSSITRWYFQQKNVCK